MQKTNIPWTDFSWNPSVGCENNCSYCYARKSHNMRHKAYLAGKKLPIQYAKPFEEIQLFPDRLEDPLHKRRPCRIFVGSVADLFSPSVPFEFIDKVLYVMYCGRQHTFQLLTKWPKRMLKYFASKELLLRLLKLFPNYNPKLRLCREWPLKNLWLGVTIELPKYKHRAEILSQIPAATRFISFEPLLGDMGELNLDGIGQGIVGCESGPKRRECRIEWVRSIVEQCKVAGVPVFVKQLSLMGCRKCRFEPCTHLHGHKQISIVSHKTEEWPEDLRVQEYPK